MFKDGPAFGGLLRGAIGLLARVLRLRVRARGAGRRGTRRRPWVESPPQVPRADWFLVADVALFSVFSGYLGIIAYEYAARDFRSAADKAHAATLMNTTFQVSMFLAVALGILISEFIS